jgi:hypothetical protein
MPSFSTLDDRCGGKTLIRLLALLLTLAVSTPVLLAQDWDHLSGRDKARDPTGVWLVQSTLPGPDGKPVLFIINFQAGGTLTEDIQGESAFDPATVTDPSSANNVITSPQSGVWQKTGWNTFAATWLAMEYHVITTPPSSPILQYAKVQYTGRLTNSGDGITFDAVVTEFDPSGTKLGDRFNFKGNGTRIPLEILPKSSDTLPIPPPPQ